MRSTTIAVHRRRRRRAFGEGWLIAAIWLVCAVQALAMTRWPL
jgi:hypothetical protein